MNLADFLVRLILTFSSEASSKSNDPNPPESWRRNDSRIHHHPFTIYIEGNVGCGKSTFLELFGGDDQIVLVQEPVAEWQNVSGTGTDMLQLMFDDGLRWSGTFQLLSTLTRLRLAIETSLSDKPIRIMERSLFSERFCFVENQYRMGKLSKVEYLLMDQWFKLIQKEFWNQIKPDLIVYLRADISTLKNRIRKRGRFEEAHIEPGFLEGLQENHDNWLLHKNSSFPIPSRVLILDSNQELQQFVKYVQARRDDILPPIHRQNL